MAQVRFLRGDLRHNTGMYALQWRRSYPIFHTCASNPRDLRHKSLASAPAGGIGSGVACESGGDGAGSAPGGSGVYFFVVLVFLAKILLSLQID